MSFYSNNKAARDAAKLEKFDKENLSPGFCGLRTVNNQLMMKPLGMSASGFGNQKALAESNATFNQIEEYYNDGNNGNQGKKNRMHMSDAMAYAHNNPRQQVL